VTTSAHPLQQPFTHEDVELFLRNYPDFFVSRDSLLSEMSLPHDSGSAISLVERQVAVLRDRGHDLRRRLSQLLDTARENDRLFQKTQQLVLGLLEAQSLDELANTLQSTLRDVYQVDTNSLLLFGEAKNFPSVNARIVTLAGAQENIGVLLNSDKPTCGVLRENEVAFLFPGSPGSVGSAVVAPLQQNGTPFGLLAIGSFDADRYRSSMGTLFVAYIAEVLDRIVPRYLSVSDGSQP
jgi:uncharacterized protein YigA (DUF484 family)